MGRQAPQNSQVDIGIVTCDVDIRVMKDAMLPVPDIGTTSDQIQRQGHQGVHPGLARIGVMPTVVLDIEADSRGGEAEEHGEGKGLPPRLGAEHQQEIGRHQEGEENRGLHVHLPTVARPAASRPKECLDPPPKLDVKPIAHAELHRSARLVGSNNRLRPRP